MIKTRNIDFNTRKSIPGQQVNRWRMGEQSVGPTTVINEPKTIFLLFHEEIAQYAGPIFIVRRTRRAWDRTAQQQLPRLFNQVDTISCLEVEFKKSQRIDLTSDKNRWAASAKSKRVRKYRDVQQCSEAHQPLSPRFF